VILVDGDILATVLSRLLGQPCIKEVQFGLHFTYILIDIALSLTGDLIEFHQEFMDLVVDLNLLPYLPNRYLIPQLEFFYLLWCVDVLLGLPCCILVAEVLPFDVI
jgi:hypothetical protein